MVSPVASANRSITPWATPLTSSEPLRAKHASMKAGPIRNALDSASRNRKPRYSSMAVSRCAVDCATPSSALICDSLRESARFSINKIRRALSTDSMGYCGRTSSLDIGPAFCASLADPLEVQLDVLGIRDHFEKSRTVHRKQPAQLAAQLAFCRASSRGEAETPSKGHEVDGSILECPAEFVFMLVRRTSQFARAFPDVDPAAVVEDDIQNFGTEASCGVNRRR